MFRTGGRLRSPHVWKQPEPAAQRAGPSPTRALVRVLSGRDRHACARTLRSGSGDPLFRLRAQGGRTGAAGSSGHHSLRVGLQRFAELPANVADEFREIVEEEEADLAEQSTPNEPSLPNGRMIQPRGKAAAGSAVVRSAGPYSHGGRVLHEQLLELHIADRAAAAHERAACSRRV